MALKVDQADKWWGVLTVRLATVSFQKRTSIRSVVPSWFATVICVTFEVITKILYLSYKSQPGIHSHIFWY